MANTSCMKGSIYLVVILSVIVLTIEQLRLQYRVTVIEELPVSSIGPIVTSASFLRTPPSTKHVSVLSSRPTLPICEGDEYHVGTWVQADQYQTFDTCSWNSHRNCVTQQAGGKERIEKSMQWNWIPSTCRLHEFNATRLHTALAIQNRRIFYFGDSLNEDMWTSLKCMMNLGEDYWDFTIGVREDFLGCPRKPDDPTYGTAEYCKDFDKLVAVWQRHVDRFKITSRDILVINTGAHWYVRPEYAATAFLDIANAIAKVFKGHVVVRTTVMGHNDCDKFEEPLQIDDKNRTEKKPLPYNWNSFGVLNDLITKAVEDSNLQDFQILYVDMFEQRPDGHHIGDKHDCLHYCVPGPIHWWNKLLYHILYDSFLFPNNDISSTDVKSMTVTLGSRNAQLRNQKEKIEGLEQKILQIEKEKVSQGIKKVHEGDSPHIESSSIGSPNSSLHICQGDEYHVGKWVQADQYQTFDTCSWNSHRNCVTQQAGGKERIEKSMQWNWIPSTCRLHEFNATRLHTALAIQNRRIFYFGDSLNEDMWTSLKCMMNLGQNYWDFTIGVREDFLGCPRKPDDPTYGTAEYCKDFDKLVAVWQRHVDRFKITSRDILVINTGAHWYVKPEYAATAFLDIANAIAKVFKGHVVVRTTVMGHNDCDKFEEPLQIDDKNRTEKKPLPYNWNSFGVLNDLITKAVEDSNLQDYQILYVDMFEQRPDGHHIGDKHDCLHYCVPGPIHWWNKLLYHILYDSFLFPNNDISSTDLKSMTVTLGSRNAQLRNQKEKIEGLEQKILQIEKEKVSQGIKKVHEGDSPHIESSSIGSPNSSLHICQGDEYHVGKWVQADQYQTFDTCSWNSHRNCVTQQTGGKERIEKSMQWNWIPSTCRLHEFNATRLHTALAIQNRRIFYFGDSLNEDMWTSLKCMMNLGQNYWDFTIGVREDFLGCPRKPDDPTYGTAEYCKDFDKLVAVWQRHVDRFKITSRDILVINTGAHWYVKPEYAATAFLDIANAIAKVFKGHVVVRTTVMGHNDCDKFEEPLQIDDKNRTEKKPLPYNWNSFGVLNDLITKAVEDSNLQDYQILYVDMFEQRPDGHHIGDKHDCLHYCVPGPIHWWNKLLYHILYDSFLFPNDNMPSTDVKSMTMTLGSRNAQLRNKMDRINELYRTVQKLENDNKELHKNREASLTIQVESREFQKLKNNTKAR